VSGKLGHEPIIHSFSPPVARTWWQRRLHTRRGPQSSAQLGDAMERQVPFAHVATGVMEPATSPANEALTFNVEMPGSARAAGTQEVRALAAKKDRCLFPGDQHQDLGTIIDADEDAAGLSGAHAGPDRSEGVRPLPMGGGSEDEGAGVMEGVDVEGAAGLDGVPRFSRRKCDMTAEMPEVRHG
jgi:hypothetical protein